MSGIERESALSFTYTVIRTRRRTLAIHVKRGQVEVRAPREAAQSWIDAFLRDKRDWIDRQLAQQRRRLSQRLVIAEGAEVPFLGRPRTVQVALSGRGKVEITDDTLVIFTRQNTPEQLEKHFNRWLLERAREYMTPRTITIARELGVEHHLKEVAFRRTRTKWGHCRQDGTIQYNWLTMMAPREVVDYLIAHECSHLRHMNHSKLFWATVAEVCPDYQTLRNWLRDNGHRFWTE